MFCKERFEYVLTLLWHRLDQWWVIKHCCIGELFVTVKWQDEIRWNDSWVAGIGWCSRTVIHTVSTSCFSKSAHISQLVHISSIVPLKRKRADASPPPTTESWSIATKTAVTGLNTTFAKLKILQIGSGKEEAAAVNGDPTSSHSFCFMPRKRTAMHTSEEVRYSFVELGGKCRSICLLISLNMFSCNTACWRYNLPFNFLHIPRCQHGSL